MKMILTSACLLAIAVAGPVLAKESDAAPSKGQAKLEKMLEGRVAGEPQSCIRVLPSTDVTVIDGTAIVYRTGRTLYVNVPVDADALDDRDALVRRTSNPTQLCQTDIITTMDRHVGHYTGNVQLTQFVPYRKAVS